jgi:formate dehydrogenase maturation protein FdhE
MSTRAHFVPNHQIKCVNCDATPTVDIYDADTKELAFHSELCGPCTFGEADTDWESKWRPE